MSDPAPASAPQPDQHLDTDAEEERLEALGEEIAETRERAAADLEVGGANRTFTDEGVDVQVERTGDTHHPLADRP